MSFLRERIAWPSTFSTATFLIANHAILKSTVNMIFRFIAYNLLRHGNVLAAALPSLDPTSDISLYPREIGTNRFTQRSTWNIISSCFATIFACSWVAIHPNIPAKSNSSVRRFFRHLMIMAYMLIIPEAVIYWAARQWWAARNIAKKHKDQRWTRTHGFFASMGGFILCDGDDKIIQTLSIERLEALALQGKISWPRISADEIMDRSKRDVFSKGFAVLQTSWFITQCIARAVYGLTITELEIATLAFAVLNGLLSFLWWNKPQAVACPHRVYLCHPSSESKREVGTQTMDPEYGENPDHHDGLSSIHSDASSMTKVSGDEDLSPEKNDPLLAKKFESTSELHISAFARCFWRLGYMAWFSICIVWRPVVLMATCNTITDSRPLSVPTFYAPYTDPLNDDSKVDTSWFHNSESLSAIIAIIVGILFGGIHCMAWSFTFLSIAEVNIWTTSSVIITVVPFAWGSVEVLAAPFRLIIKCIKTRRWYDHESQSVAEFSHPSCLRELHSYTGLMTLVVYFSSRAALLILPIIALRSLSSDSLLELSWSSYIPHI